MMGRVRLYSKKRCWGGGASPRVAVGLACPHGLLPPPVTVGPLLRVCSGPQPAGEPAGPFPPPIRSPPGPPLPPPQVRGRGGQGTRGLEAPNPTPPLRKSSGCPKGGLLWLVGPLPCPRRASSPSPFVEVASARRGQSPTCRAFPEPLGPASGGPTAPARTTASAPQPALAASLPGTALAELVFKSWTWVVHYCVGSGLPEEPASLPPVFPPGTLHRDFVFFFFLASEGRDWGRRGGAAQGWRHGR